MAYENYSARIAAIGNTVQDRFERVGKRTVKNYINSTINKTAVLINDVGLPVNVSLVKDRVSDIADQRDIIAEVSAGLSAGDIVKEVESGFNWIVIAHIKHQVEDWFRGIAKMCNEQLNWKVGDVRYSLPIYYSNPVSNALRNLQMSGSLMVTNVDELSLIVPYRASNKHFRINDRFFIGDEVYKVVQLNRNMNNIWYLAMKKDAFNNATDNFIEKIADFSKPVNKLNKTFINARFKNVQLTIGNTYPITALLDIVLTDSLNDAVTEPYTVTSLNSNATVSGNNITIAAHGEYSFKIFTSDNENDFTTVDFTNDPLAAVKISIIGEDKIVLGDTKAFTIEKIVAGAPVIEAWTASINNAQLATLQVVNGQSVKLVANENMKTGTIRLTFTNNTTAEVVFKDIVIESWWRK